MKNGKKLTRAQKRKLEQVGMSPVDWLSVKNLQII